MADAEDTLGAKLRDAWWQGVSGQAKAYKDFGALLDRWAKRDIKTLDYGRDALDIYIDATRTSASVGVQAVRDVLDTGIERVSKARKSVEPAIEELARKVGAAAKPAKAGRKVTRARAPVLKTSTAPKPSTVPKPGTVPKPSSA